MVLGLPGSGKRGKKGCRWLPVHGAQGSTQKIEEIGQVGHVQVDLTHLDHTRKICTN